MAHRSAHYPIDSAVSSLGNSRKQVLDKIVEMELNIEELAGVIAEVSEYLVKQLQQEKQDQQQ